MNVSLELGPDAVARLVKGGFLSAARDVNAVRAAFGPVQAVDALVKVMSDPQMQA